MASSKRHMLWTSDVRIRIPALLQIEHEKVCECKPDLDVSKRPQTTFNRLVRCGLILTRYGTCMSLPASSRRAVKHTCVCRYTAWSCCSCCRVMLRTMRLGRNDSSNSKTNRSVLITSEQLAERREWHIDLAGCLCIKYM